jgi:hypothetical protein
MSGWQQFLSASMAFCETATARGNPAAHQVAALKTGKAGRFTVYRTALQSSRSRGSVVPHYGTDSAFIQVLFSIFSLY